MRTGADGRKYFGRGEAINPAALRQARRERGWSLAQVAEGIVTRQALHQFEAGRARPTREKLRAIAQRLEIPVDTLLARPHDPRETTMRELEERQVPDELERLANAVLSDLNITPRTQAVALFYLGRAVLTQAPGEALGHLRRARGLLAKFGEPWLSAEARDWEGMALYLLQDLEALDVGRDALARYRVLVDRDPAVEARMLEHIGTYQLQREEVVEAKTSYCQAIEVAGNVLNLSRMANIYHGLASSCVRLGQARQALDYFDRAVGFARTHHDVKGAATVNLVRLENDYGDLLIRTGRFDRAEEMIQSALDRLDAAGIVNGRADPMLGMGEVKYRQGQMALAMQWTNDAISLAERLGETISLALGYEQLGELYASQGNLDQCDAAFSRAVELYKHAGLPERRAAALEHYRRVRRAAAESQRGS